MTKPINLKTHTTRGAPRKRAAMPGSGRPSGSKTGLRLANDKVAKVLAAGGVKEALGAHDGTVMPEGFTPLDVMEAAMRRAWELGGPLFAFNFAKEAAPFRHAKLSSATVGGPGGGTGVGGSGGNPVRVVVEFVKPKARG